jgi:carotenoid cleavage dioxygenase-like enzyme
VHAHAAQVAFVPLKAGGAEDEGVLLTFAYVPVARPCRVGGRDARCCSYDPNDARSYVVVVDAQSMQMSARIALPRRVPFGFHCTFAPE